MSPRGSERRAGRRAARADRRRALADKKRTLAEAYLPNAPADLPATPHARGFETCPCPKDCTLHGECLLCVAYHARNDRAPRCLR